MRLYSLIQVVTGAGPGPGGDVLQRPELELQGWSATTRSCYVVDRVLALRPSSSCGSGVAVGLSKWNCRLASVQWDHSGGAGCLSVGCVARRLLTAR